MSYNALVINDQRYLVQGSCEVGVKLNPAPSVSYNALVINEQRYPVQGSCEVGVKLNSAPVCVI